MTPLTLFFVAFWTVIVFASIAWYAFLLLYVGLKAARDIRQLTRELKARQP